MSDLQQLPRLNVTADERRRQKTATHVLFMVFNTLYPRSASPAQWAKQLAENVRAAYWEDICPAEPSQESLRACADVMHAIADHWDDAAGMMRFTD